MASDKAQADQAWRRWNQGRFRSASRDYSALRSTARAIPAIGSGNRFEMSRVLASSGRPVDPAMVHGGSCRHAYYNATRNESSSRSGIRPGAAQVHSTDPVCLEPPRAQAVSRLHPRMVDRGTNRHHGVDLAPRSTMALETPAATLSGGDTEHTGSGAAKQRRLQDRRAGKTISVRVACSRR